MGRINPLNKPGDTMTQSNDFAEQLKQILARPGFVFPGSHNGFAESAQRLLDQGVAEAEAISVLNDIYTAGTERPRSDAARKTITLRIMGYGFEKEEAIKLIFFTIDQLTLNPLTESCDDMIPGFDEQLAQIMARPGFDNPESSEVFTQTARKLLSRGIAGSEVIGIMGDVYVAGTEYHGSFEAGFDVSYRVMRNGFDSDDAFELTHSAVKMLNWVTPERKPSSTVTYTPISQGEPEF